MKKSTQFPFLDKYSRVARLYPAIISLIPALLLSIGLVENELTQILGEILSVRVLGCVSINVAALFLLIQTNRFVGKEIFEKLYFEDELCMPTTDMLLPLSTTISPNLRKKIAEQCISDFGLALPTVEEQEADDLLARRRVIEIVALIRQKVRGGYLLLQHNIEYGFVRNLIGGAPLALVISLVDVAYFYNKAPGLFVFSLFLTVVWILLLLASKTLIKRFGVLYAKRLIQEYSGGIESK